MSDTTLSSKDKAVTETNPRIDASSREKLITARVGLLLRAGFFGNLATRLKLVNADKWCPTAATDGRTFWYNSEFINRLSLKECEFLFGHEVLHVVYDHLGRRGDRDPVLSNIAADYCVNSDLIDHNIGQKITTVPILYDRKYRGMSFEEVYDDLYKNAKKIDLQKLMQQMLDEHLEDEGDEEQDGDGDQDGDKVQGENGRPRLSKAEGKALRDEIKEAILQAAQACGAGDLPAGVQRLIKDMTESVIDWRELLLQQIQSTIKNDFSWIRPNRRSWHMDAVLPGMKPGETVDLCVAIDTSGSIGEEELKIFLSEIKGIMESYDDYKISVWSFDTDVYNMQEFTQDNMSDIMEYEPKGGGGTDFTANWRFMKDEQIEPKKLIVFTDGMPFGEWGDEDYCDTVWIIKGNPGVEPPFGIWAHYEDAVKG
jgi:predicted metal-dependent peptidase